MARQVNIFFWRPLSVILEWFPAENAVKIAGTARSVLPQRGAIAQLGERVVRNDEAVGSIPTSSTKLQISRYWVSFESVQELSFRKRGSIARGICCFGRRSRFLTDKSVRN